MSDLRENIKIDFSNLHIKGKVCVFDFMDNGHHVAYLPSLNLSGYGDTREEAHDLLMNFVLKDFLEGLFALSQEQILAELKNLGWEKSRFLNEDFSKTFVDKKGVLREFNLPAETEIQSQLMAVA